MSTTPEAIAAKLEAASRDRWAFGLDLAGAAAELRRLAAVEAERDQLRAEVEALRADAERYRWLRVDDNDELVMRTYDHDATGRTRAFDSTRDNSWLPRESELDAAVDAARKG